MLQDWVTFIASATGQHGAGLVQRCSCKRVALAMWRAGCRYSLHEHAASPAALIPAGSSSGLTISW